jgi:hypothetical protein
MPTMFLNSMYNELLSKALVIHGNLAMHGNGSIKLKNNNKHSTEAVTYLQITLLHPTP